MPRLSPRSLRWLPAAIATAAFLLAYPLWFRALGGYLVRADQPARADVIVVLAGDYYGQRILKAGELARAGYAPLVLVSGPAEHYGYYECDLAIPFAVQRGHAREYFAGVRHTGNSTAEEAGALASELRRRRARKVLLVTSDYHTRRAGRIFRAAAPELDIRVVAAPDRFFRADGWWRSRQGRKQFVFEWAKTLASWIGA